MKVFFQKHPVELDYSVAVNVIKKKVDLASHKCKESDEAYLTDLAKAYEMIDDYFSELGLNPTSLL